LQVGKIYLILDQRDLTSEMKRQFGDPQSGQNSAIAYTA
jgi:hypothetical protein